MAQHNTLLLPLPSLVHGLEPDEVREKAHLFWLTGSCGTSHSTSSQCQVVLVTPMLVAEGLQYEQAEDVDVTLPPHEFEDFSEDVFNDKQATDSNSCFQSHNF